MERKGEREDKTATNVRWGEKHKNPAENDRREPRISGGDFLQRIAATQSIVFHFLFVELTESKNIREREKNISLTK